MNDEAEGDMRKMRIFAAFEWLIAFRYMWPNRKQIFTSVITIISFIGIVIGVWALIVVMSVMNGFRTELLNRILGMNGHIIMQPIDSDFTDYADLIARLDKVEGVKYVLPVVEGQVLAQGEGGGGTGAFVRGLREQDIKNLASVAGNIKQGSLKNFDKGESIAIGSGLSERLALGVGAKISLVSPDGDATPFGINPRMKTYKIGAIYEVGMSEYDAGIIFMPLREAQLFFNQEGKVQSLEIFVQNPDNVDMMRGRLESAAGRETYMLDWRQRNRSFFATLQVERNVMFIILSLIILVAALNIISGLVMLVKDKGHDIAVLRTIGATRAAVMRIFMITGTAVGIGGTFFGVVLGVATALNISYIQSFVSWLFDVDVFNKDIYFLSEVPAKIDAGQTFMVVFMALLLSFLATLAPAWYASRLDPVQALRYE